MKKITVKKLLQLSDEKLGMEKQYYTKREDLRDGLSVRNLSDDLVFTIKTISDEETTTFGKKVYLCEYGLSNVKGWINMEVSEFNQLETI
jgi:hypothetical protein